MEQAVWPPGSPDTVCPRPSVTLTFDLETGVQVASKVGNLHSKFGHARPLGSRIIRYVRDGRIDRRTYIRTDGRTKATLIVPSLRWGHNNIRYNTRLRTRVQHLQYSTVDKLAMIENSPVYYTLPIQMLFSCATPQTTLS